MPQQVQILGGFRTIYGAKLAAARLASEGVPPSRIQVLQRHHFLPAGYARQASLNGRVGALLSVTSPDIHTRHIAQRALLDAGALVLETFPANAN